MKNLYLSGRDLGFLMLGIVLAIFIGGYFNGRFVTESLKNDVLNWLNNKTEIKEIELRTGIKLTTNTAIPGIIWIIFDKNKFSDDKLKDVSFYLSNNLCPYGVSKISRNE